jgi:hypothetical protein
MGHQHAWWPAVSLLAALLLLAAGTCGAGEIRLGARLGGGFYGHDDVNDTLDDVARLAESVCDDGYDGGCAFSSDDLQGGFLFAVNGEYLPNESWGIGAEFLPLSSDGGWNYHSTYEDDYGYWTEWDNVDHEAPGKLLSAYAVYRIPMGDGPLVLRLGGGIDYIFGAKLTYDADYYVEYSSRDARGARSGRETIEGRASFDASGSALGFHGRAGVEYQVAERFVLVGDAALRFLKVDELEVDNPRTEMDGEPGAWDDMEEGEPLKWIATPYSVRYNTVDGKKIGLDFSGLYLTVGAFYTF